MVSFMTVEFYRAACAGLGCSSFRVSLKQMSRSAPIIALLVACSLLGAAQAAEPPVADTPIVDRDGKVPAGEAALKSGDCRTAAETYVRAAVVDRNPRVARRALGVAGFCKHQPAEWQAAQRLYELDPENPDALRAVGVAALDLWKIDFAQRAFGELIAKPDVEPARAWNEILPPLVEGSEAPAAWRVFGTLVPRKGVDADVLANLAVMACTADALDQCAELLAAARVGDGADEPRLVRMAAMLAVAKGDPERALAEARRLAKIETANQRFAVVDVLLALDRTEEARGELERLGADRALAPEVERRLALLAFATGDAADAERRFTARLERKEGAGEALFYLAVLAERAGREEQAMRAYQQLIVAGGGLTVRSRAAQLLLGRGERESVNALFDDLLRGNADTVIEVEIARANAFTEAGAHDLALRGIDAALERRPQHSQLRYQRAVALDAAGRTREAVSDLEALLVDRPDDATVLNALGYTLADRRMQLPRAEKLIRAALAQRPDNAAFIDSLGWVRYRRGDFKSAAAALERAWRLTRQADIAAHWGEVLWESGARDRARAVWVRALAASPESKPLRAVVDRYTASGKTRPTR